MNPSRFELTSYAKGVPVLIGRSDAFTKFHARMEKAIVAQNRNANYKNGYNFPIESAESCFNDLYSTAFESVLHIHREVFQNDLSISPGNKRTCWAFVLDENRPAVDVWHNHVKTSTYNTVYYLRTNTGDGFNIIIPEDIRNPRMGQELEIPVQEGMLLVIPNWLFHKPKPIKQRRGALRISINMEIIAAKYSVLDSLLAFGIPKMAD